MTDLLGPPAPGPGDPAEWTDPPTSPPALLARYGSWPMVLAIMVLSTLVGSALSFLLVDLLFGGDSRTADSLATPEVLFLAILVTDGVLLGAVYLVLVRRGVTTWTGLGLGRGDVSHPVLRGAGYGLLFLLVVGAVSIALAGLGIQQDQAQQFPITGAGTWGKAAILLAGIGFAPFAEELFFRGFILQAMSQRKGRARGVLYSSALFALVHANLAAFLPLVAGAAVLAVSFRRTRTLWVPVTAHAVNNAVALTALMLGS